MGSHELRFGIASLHGSQPQVTVTRTDGRTVRLEGTVTANRIEGRTGGGAAWSARVRKEAGGSILEWEEPPPGETN